MDLLTADEILGANDKAFEDVPTPEWRANAGVRVRRLSAGEWRALEQQITAAKEDGGRDVFTLVVGACACGADEKPLFTAEQLTALSEKSCAPMKRLFAACQRLNAFGQTEADDTEKK